MTSKQNFLHFKITEKEPNQWLVITACEQSRKVLLHELNHFRLRFDLMSWTVLQIETFYLELALSNSTDSEGGRMIDREALQIFQIAKCLEDQV